MRAGSAAMTVPPVVWVGAGYLVGTFPSTFLVAKAKGADELLAASSRRAGEADPHILLSKMLGPGWGALAATVDVLKGLLPLLALRFFTNLDTAWLALAGLAVVLGHAFPFYEQRMAGRGLAASSGVLLALLPVEMSIAGLLIVLGALARRTGLASTIGMFLVPVLALLRGRPGELVLMAVGIFVIVMVRRSEGFGDVVQTGVAPSKAILYRCLFDSSGPPGGPVS